jgi:hypothetical protein
VPYSFRQAYEYGGFLQRDLITVDQLAREADKRGMRIGSGSSAQGLLEELDKEGLLSPIAFIKDRYIQASYHRLLGRPELLFREELPFRAWKTYRWREEDRNLRQWRVTALYSPWQLMFLNRALKFRWLRVSAADLADKRRADRLMENAQQVARQLLDSLGKSEAEWRSLMLLLVRIQNRYWPYVGSYTLEHDPRTRQYIDPIARERRVFSARRALADLELTADDVRGYHERLSFFLQQEDPIPQWWVLRRMASRYQREQMKGAARCVEDLWEATQMLRLFYRQLTRRVLPDANLVGRDPRMQERVLGHEARLFYDQLDLLRFLSRNDFYPHQVHVFVEGASEEILLTRILEAWLGQLEARGIRFTDLRGIDNISQRHQELFEGFANYARASVLIADNESEIARYVADLTAQRLINPQGVQLWNKNLEEDNFSDAELVRAIRAIAGERGALSKGLNGRLVRSRYERRRNRQGGPATFVEELLRLAAHPDHGSVRVSKRDLAGQLADSLLQELEDGNFDELRSKRPILQRAEMIVQLAQGARFADDGEEY